MLGVGEKKEWLEEGEFYVDLGWGEKKVESVR